MKYKTHDNNQVRSGFTMIEVTVALTVFIIFIGIIMKSFVHLVGLQIEANRYRKVYGELNEILALVTTDAREFGIDYNCFDTPLCDPESVIAFISKDGLEQRVIKVADLDSDDSKSAVKLSYSVQKRNSITEVFPQPSFQPLVTDNTEFKQFSFKVHPTEDPYNSSTSVDDLKLFQPSLQIFAEAIAKSHPDKPGILMQTTVSSRLYNVRSF